MQVLDWVEEPDKADLLGWTVGRQTKDEQHGDKSKKLWTPEADERLRVLVLDGKSPLSISAHLKRTRERREAFPLPSTKPYETSAKRGPSILNIARTAARMACLFQRARGRSKVPYHYHSYNRWL
jgi:hypothetical protein